MILMNAPLLFIALLLDAVLGEPRWLWRRLPHPVVAVGRMITWGDQTFNQGRMRRLKGALFIATLSFLAIFLGRLIELLPLGWLWSILGAAILLAQKSLSQHILAVADALRGSVDQGRETVAKIVGRETGAMDEPAIARAAIESAAENLSDGVVAPALWFLVGGLPGIIFYKVINTADSMIGHRTPRYREFGWAAARLDDVLNWLPARVTALLCALTHPGHGGWRRVWSDAGHHRSPNAGWPEAAMAGILGVALSGPRAYHGNITTDPFLNPDGAKNISAIHIEAAVEAIWRIWGAVVGGIFFLTVL